MPRHAERTDRRPRRRLASPPGKGAAPRASLDLLAGAATTAELLAESLEAGDWLDAYLFAAALWQLIEDHCSAAHLVIRRAGAMWLGRTDGPGPVLGQLAGRLDRAAGALSAASPNARRLARLSDRVAELVRTIAPVVVQEAGEPGRLAPGQPASRSSATRLRRRGLAVAVEVAESAFLLEGDVVKVPSCFYSFDLHPRDLAELAGDFARRFPDRRRRLFVLGLRSSGSYLAPLLAASLARLGFAHLDSSTMRPGWALCGLAASLRRTAGGGGLVLLVDDPPGSGRSLLVAADQLRREAGVADPQIVLVLPVFAEAAALPAGLAGIERVELGFSRWDITRRLAPAALEGALSRLTGAEVAVEVSPGALEVPGRGHAGVRIRASWRNGPPDVPAAAPAARTGGTGETAATIHAEGAGLGHYARRACALAAAAPELVPAVIGVVDGVLFTRRPPEQWRLAGAPGGEEAGRIARHLAERHRALPVRSDRSLAIRGRCAAWEIASRCAARPLGPLAGPGRLLMVDRLVRALLSTSRPCIVDGDLRPANWFFPPEPAAAVKTGFFEGTFGHNDLASCDPAFDVAGAAVAFALAFADPAFGDELRRRYERASGLAIEPERFLLLQLVHLFDAARHQRAEMTAIERRSSAAVVELFASRLLADLEPPADGELCVFDLDGVLETSAAGFPGFSEQSMLALRALRAHGRRILLASGRSLDELTERCRLLRLEGAVAEYGAAAYVAGTGEVIELVPEGDRRLLERLRSEIVKAPGVSLDPAYRRIVRCSQLGPGSRRRPVEAKLARRLIQAAGATGSIIALDGCQQSDFVPVGIDKATALLALLAACRPRSAGAAPAGAAPAGAAPAGAGAKPFALAVGDSPADRSFLALAKAAYAPSHSELPAGEGLTVLGRPYQAGTAEAVGRFLGHEPGGCPSCAPPPLEPAVRALLRLLSLHEAGTKGIPARLLRLAAGAAALPFAGAPSLPASEGERR